MPEVTIRMVSATSPPVTTGVYTTLHESLTTYRYLPLWSLPIAASLTSIACASVAYGRSIVKYIPLFSSLCTLRIFAFMVIVPVLALTDGDMYVRSAV